MMPELAYELVDLFAFEFSNLALNLLLLLQVIPVLFGVAQFPKQRQFRRFMAARENSMQSVIISGRNWIKLMIMTTRTSHREPQRAAADDVDPVIDDVVLVI